MQVPNFEIFLFIFFESRVLKVQITWHIEYMAHWNQQISSHLVVARFPSFSRWWKMDWFFWRSSQYGAKLRRNCLSRSCVSNKTPPWRTKWNQCVTKWKSTQHGSWVNKHQTRILAAAAAAAMSIKVPTSTRHTSPSSASAYWVSEPLLLNFGNVK